SSTSRLIEQVVGMSYAVAPRDYIAPPWARSLPVAKPARSKENTRPARVDWTSLRRGSESRRPSASQIEPILRVTLIALRHLARRARCRGLSVREGEC